MSTMTVKAGASIKTDCYAEIIEVRKVAELQKK